MKVAAPLIALVLTIVSCASTNDFRCPTKACASTSRCLQEGGELLSAGQFVEAGCRFKSARTSDPLSDDAAVGHAVALTLVGWHETARPIFQQLAAVAANPRARDTASQWLGLMDEPRPIVLSFDKTIDCFEPNPEWSNVEPGQMVTKWLADRLRHLKIVSVQNTTPTICDGCDAADFRIHIQSWCPRSERGSARAAISIYDARGELVHSMSAESTTEFFQLGSTPAMKAASKIDNAMRKMTFDLIFYLAHERPTTR